MTQTLLLVDAAQPGALDLGEIVLFSLGNHAYIVSLPTSYHAWHEHLKNAILNTLGREARLLLCERQDGQRPSFASLQDSADLKTLLTPIVQEILESNHAQTTATD